MDPVNRHHLLHALAALAVGLLGVVVVVGPDPTWTLQELPGYDNTDQWGAIYLHHHHHARVLAGAWPGVDPNQMVPEGLPLAALNGGNTMEMWISLAIRAVLSWPAWFSWAHLVWIPILVLSFQPLGWALWERRGASLAAGLAWALWPFHLGEMSAGRLTQLALVGAPLAVTGLLALGDGRWRRGAVGLALTALGYWFYGLFMAMLVPVFALWARFGAGRSTRAVMLDLSRMGVAALVLVSPWLCMALWPRLSGAWVPDPGGGPGGASAVFDMALKLEGTQPRSARGWFPGIFALGALVTMRWGRRRLLWSSLAGIAVLFALGPATHFRGMDWHLPYEVLWGVVPMLSRLNHPVRWLGVAGLFVVVLAADGLARRRPGLTWLLPVGVAAHLWWTGRAPLEHHVEQVPEHWARLDNIAAEGGVIVVPIGRSAESIRAVHLHGRPLLGGMVEGLVWARPPAWSRRIESNSALAQLALVSTGQVDRITWVDSDVQAVRDLGFRTIVADLDLVGRVPGGRPEHVRSVLTEALGRPLYSDSHALVWHFPTSGTTDRTPNLPPVWGRR